MFIEDILKCLEYLLSKIRFELVIVFTLNVDDELQIFRLGTFGQGLDRLSIDSSLNCVFLNVVNILIC